MQFTKQQTAAAEKIDVFAEKNLGKHDDSGVCVVYKYWKSAFK